MNVQCVRNAYQWYCGPQIAHGMCEITVNFIRRLDVLDLNCLGELSALCNKTPSKKLSLVVIMIIVFFGAASNMSF